MSGPIRYRSSRKMAVATGQFDNIRYYGEMTLKRSSSLSILLDE